MAKEPSECINWERGAKVQFSMFDEYMHQEDKEDTDSDKSGGTKSPTAAVPSTSKTTDIAEQVSDANQLTMEAAEDENDVFVSPGKSPSPRSDGEDNKSKKG